MSDERQLADQLETYLEHPEENDGLLEPPVEDVVSALQQAATDTQPRPGFINELAQQLRQKETTMSAANPQTTRPLWKRLLAGGLALAGLLLLAYVGSSIFMQPDIEPAASDLETPLPSTVETANSGHFAGMEFRLLPELSGEPQEVTLYEAQSQPLPSTPQGARELAASLGIQNPQVYHNPSQPSQWIVMGDGGASITLNPTQPEFAGLYYTNQATDPADNAEPLPLPEATATAEAFLENAGLLPPEYEVSERSQANYAGMRFLRFTPLLDGRPVVGHEGTIDVDVGPDGTVRSARATPVRYVPLDDVRPMQSAEDAFQQLLSGPGNYSFSFQAASRDRGYQIFRPQEAGPQAGEQVTFTGMVNVLVGVEREQVRAIFHPLQTTTAYELRGALLEELRDVGYGTPLRITGISGEAPESGRPPLEMLSWEPAPEAQRVPTCLTGTASRTNGETLILESNDGQSYELAEGPEALGDGQRIEVCATSFDGDGPVAWLSITAPPASEANAGGGGGGGGSATVVEAVEAVEVTRTVSEVTGGAARSESQPAESESGVAVARPVEGEGHGALTSLELGETVTLTGTVEGVDYGGDQGLQLGLVVALGQNPLSVTYDYVPLQGEPELLQEIAQHYHVHVTVSGTVVPAEDSRMADKALEVDSYSRPWPDEQLEDFLGHMEEATVGGRDVVLFIDEDTGDRYVVSHGMPQVDPEQKMAVAGVVHPTWQVEGLPVLRTYQQRTGPDVDAMESAADLPPLERSVPLARQGGGPQLQGPLVVETVRLGYSLEVGPGARGESNQSKTLTPVWIFEGHTADGSQTFQIEIDAASGQ